MTKKTKNGLLNCSFCNKSQRDVKKLIAGPNVYICDECVQLCTDITADDPSKKKKPKKLIKSPKPSKIKNYLDKYVVGQDLAKKTLSVAVYNHYKRINDIGYAGVEIQKSNILLLGPTGCGKTLLAQSLAKMLDVPFTIVDATSITEAGYVGEDVDSIIQNLYAISDNDIEKTQQGIIYLDEIDKISSKADGPNSSRDVSGEGVQQGLLKLIEGSKVSITPRGTKKYGQTENNVQIDTSNILFICGGAFNGISDIITRRTGKKGIGFGANIQPMGKQSAKSIAAQITTKDLVSYGLIPEFVGRLPVIASLDNISAKDLVSILTKPKNALVKQYQKLFDMENVQLQFTDEALEYVATVAAKRKSGARGLRSVLETAMLDIMYHLPLMENVISCTITKDVIEHNKEPIFVYKKEKKSA